MDDYLEAAISQADKIRDLGKQGLLIFPDPSVELAKMYALVSIAQSLGKLVERP